VIEFRKNAAGGSRTNANQASASTPRPTPGRRAAQIGGCVAVVGSLTVLIVLGIIGLTVWTTTRQSDVNFLDVPEPTRAPEQPTALPSADNTTLSSTRKLLALPLGDVPAGTQPRSVVLVRSQDDQKYHLALLDLAKQQRVWIGPALSENAYGYGQLAATTDTLVFADDRTLHGFLLRDGSQRWASQMSDRVCDTCLLIAKHTAVVLTVDDMLAGFDLDSGERLWNLDLGKSAGRQILLVGDQVLAFDTDAKSHGQIALIDPVSGKPTRSITPSCNSKTFPDTPIYMNSSDTSWLSPDQQTLILVSSSIDTCIHSYDLASGKQRWQTVQTDRLDLRDSPFLLNGSELLVGAENQILAINQASGEITVAFTNDEYTFRPLQIRDGVLATIAVKQRGTQRIELWGVDPQNGKRLWRHEFPGDGKMFESPYQAYGTISDTEQIWTLSDTSAGLVLITLAAKPHHYTFAVLDAKSGQIAATKTLDLPPTDTVWVPDVITRIGDLIYIDDQSHLLGIDVVRGVVAYQGP
jgi:outer membrane protein assembly factor BamB